MKLVTFQVSGKERIGELRGSLVYDIRLCCQFNPSQTCCTVEEVNMVKFLELGDEAIVRAKETVDYVEGLLKQPAVPLVYKLDEITLSAPVMPRKLFALAGNYSEHIKEGGGEVPEKTTTTPRVFMKPPTTTVNDPNGTIIISKNAQKIDWEAELGVVIGKRGKYISASEAYDYVVGYTVVNDVSERSLKVPETREPRDGDEWFDWLNGKWLDSFAPMGPCITTKDEIADPHNLRITLRVNGETKQDANTGQMIFSVAELIEWISSFVTLEPGDVISTGTPSGVGSTTGTFLKDGDLLETEIEGIGVLKNPVKAEK